MNIGEHLRELRERKELSQGDIEKRTGLIRCYTSRVENGFTIPSLETLEKYAHALEVPLYQLFYNGEKPPKLPKRRTSEETEWGRSGKNARFLMRLRRLIGRMDESDRRLLLHMAQRMAMRVTRTKARRARRMAA